MTRPAGKHWDIFCKIVDNFGDIGVCWRLSQQLANEFAINVRLFIDDIHIAHKIIPNLDINKFQQTINQVQIIVWASIEADQLALNKVDVALETFGSELPAKYLQLLSSKTIWINLEYLSAEGWVSDFHAKPSRHPTLPLTKYYFFPGFLEDTGGLIREKDLIKQRDAFITSQALQKSFWQRIIPTAVSVQDLKLSLFCYPQAQIKKLIEDLQATNQRISLFIPFTSTISEIGSQLAGFKHNIGEVYVKNNLTIYVVPFLSQGDYDQLLWACNLNFVRGEDSWIRAIWAGKPFVWQPYIQTDDAHLNKLNAFLDFYTENASEKISTLIKHASLSWSGYGETNNSNSVWPQLINQLSSLGQHSKQQAAALTYQPDLATKLVIFSEKLQENQV